MGDARPEFVRPIVVAIAFTLLGELLSFYIWGIPLFPEGILWNKLVWTVTCGIAMGATIGALVNIAVTGRVIRRERWRGGIAGLLFSPNVLHGVVLPD